MPSCSDSGVGLRNVGYRKYERDGEQYELPARMQETRTEFEFHSITGAPRDPQSDKGSHVTPILIYAMSHPCVYCCQTINNTLDQTALVFAKRWSTAVLERTLDPPIEPQE